MSDATERWLPVVGYEGLYEVSDLGKVQSLDRDVRYSNGRLHHHRGKVLTPFPDQEGYPQVWLHRNGKVCVRRVHRLVGAAFLGELPEGMQTLHGPAGTAANGAEDIRYGTGLQNSADMVRDGTRLRGAQKPAAKLNEDIVRDCRRRHGAGGISYRHLAAEYGVAYPVMRRAIRRETWSHVDA